MNDAIVMLEGPDQRAQELDAFKSEFLRYASQPDLSQPCLVGRLMTDFNGGKLRQHTWQVVADAMTERDEFMRRAIKFLCEQARYGDTTASRLLSDMAEHWAELRCDL
jgi:hypothetical protein